MESEDSSNVVPINQTCSKVINTEVIVPSPGSVTATTTQNADNISNQQKANAQFDNVDDLVVKPMYGGIQKKFIINFRNKIMAINTDNEINAIKKILNNKIYKKDYLLEISEEISKNKKNKSMYIIRGRYKNKFKKIYENI